MKKAFLDGLMYGFGTALAIVLFVEALLVTNLLPWFRYTIELSFVMHK